MHIVFNFFLAKGCLGHYLKNLRNLELLPYDKMVLICNILDLLRCSALRTTVLIEDFRNANGYQTIVDFCTKYKNCFT